MGKVTWSLAYFTTVALASCALKKEKSLLEQKLEMNLERYEVNHAFSMPYSINKSHAITGTPEEIMNEVHKRVKYKSEDEDYWQMPWETDKLGTGDCEDYAIYLYDQLNRNGIKSEIVVGKMTGANDEGFHAWIEYKDNGESIILDPTSNLKIYRLTLEELKIDAYKQYHVCRDKINRVYRELSPQ